MVGAQIPGRYFTTKARCFESGPMAERHQERQEIRRLRRFRRFDFQNLRPSAKSAENCFLVIPLVVQICIECHAAHFGHVSKPAESKKLVEREPRGSRVEEDCGGDAEAAGVEVDCRARRRTRATFLRSTVHYACSRRSGPLI